MIGQDTDSINRRSTLEIVIRDAVITFIITLISVLIANPPFDVPIMVWLKNIYVPILTAVLTAVVSYANAAGGKKR